MNSPNPRIKDRLARSQAIAVPQPRNCQKNPCTVRLSTRFNDFSSGD